MGKLKMTSIYRFHDYTRIGSNKGKTPEHNEYAGTFDSEVYRWYRSKIATTGIYRYIPVAE